MLAAGTLRGTQSLVAIFSRCWHRPLWTLIEVLWRWVVGIPLLLIAAWMLRGILGAHTGGTFDLDRLGLDRRLLEDPVGTAAADPLGAVGKWGATLASLLPDVLHVAAWLVPVAVLAWIVVGSLGRTLLLRRMDGRLASRPGTLMLLQTARLAAMGSIIALWFWGLRWIVSTSVTAPMAAGGEPELVLYFALSIVLTLGLFSLWAVVSWLFFVAPLIAMLRGLGPLGGLAAAYRVGALRSKLVEINLVLGIVKIALLVLATVLSATPLPFESVTSSGFLAFWWVLVGVLYLVASDYVHVVRLLSYLELWRAYQRSDLD